MVSRPIVHLKRKFNENKLFACSPVFTDGAFALIAIYRAINTHVGVRKVMEKNRPVGIFDSGLGGLTVAKAVKDLLPGERLVYFGDSAHLPYGDKSAATIQAYSVKICDVLLQHDCKVILIACNSASSAAFELVKAYVGSKALVLNVIDPVISYLIAFFQGKTVGLIGTKQTVGSNVYRNKLDLYDRNIQLRSLATPLLAPMIEESFHKKALSEKIIAEYLSNSGLNGIEALVLGCTHYPLIRKQIENYFEGQVEVIDSSEIVAQSLKELLSDNDLMSSKKSAVDEFLVSDFTESFQAATSLFFGRNVKLEKHVLWE